MPTQTFPSGDFSAWLSGIRQSFTGSSGSDVPCGDCVGCCSSSQFIHVRPDDLRALSRIDKTVLFSAPGLPRGNLLMGYDQQGRCPQLHNGQCRIYADRPQTCREYDCRIFAAAGISAGGKDKTAINQRVKKWQFSYPTEQDRKEHLAVSAAAAFIRNNAKHFPGGRIPDDPKQLALLAIKVYPVFLAPRTGSLPNDKIAAAIIEESRK